MRKSLATAVAAALSFSAVAENAFQARLVEQSTLLDAAASEFVVIVGERGHILTSLDGESFKQADVPAQSTLTAVDVVGDKIWAVGHDATILHSADKGETWTTQLFNPDIERPFLDVSFFDDKHGIAVGAYGLFYRTTDGGKNWTAERHAELLNPYDLEYLEEIREEDEEFYLMELDSILPHINRVNQSGDKLFLAGEAGLLAHSEDQGKTWARYELDYEGSFFDIRAIDNENVLAAGLRGNMYVKSGEGRWKSVATCNTSTLNSVHISDDFITAMGNNGILVKATLPLPTVDYPSYGAICETPEGVEVSQIQDKSAILTAFSFNGKTIAVTANGIQTLNLEP